MGATLADNQSFYTEADVARIVAAAVEQVTRDGSKPRSYTLRQVAALTGLPWRKIADGCRAGTIDHVVLQDSNLRVMTDAQIAKLLADNTRRDAPPAATEPADELARAREASRRSQRRQTSGRKR